jgi:DNA-binding transcriptional MerR regulator
MATGAKSPDAFRTIGELSAELGVAQHILRYWETKFPQLRPLQRAGNRRYYRPADVALARRIHRLLNEEGYTVRGVQKLLRDKSQADEPALVPPPAAFVPEPPSGIDTPVPEEQGGGIDIFRLIALRNRLADALAE